MASGSGSAAPAEDPDAKEYVLRAPKEDEASRAVEFLGSFPLGAPKFHDEDINSTWRLRAQKPPAAQRRRNPRVQEPEQWHLEDRPGHTSHKGQREGGLGGSYFVIFREGSEFVAMPAEKWVKFKPHYQMENALTLDEAENIMSNRSKAASKITQKLKINEAPKEEEQKMMRTGVDSDGEDDIAVGLGRARNRGSDDDDPGGPPDSPEKGEDFDFDEIFDNDDEAVGTEDEPNEEEEHKPKGMKTEEEEEDEEEDLDDSGKSLKKIFKKHHAEGYESDESQEEKDKTPVKTEEEEEEDDSDEDLDAMATKVDANQARQSQAGPRAPTPPLPRAAAKNTKSATPPPKRKLKGDDEDVPLSKKMRSDASAAVKTGTAVKAEPARAGKTPTPDKATKPDTGKKKSPITREQVVGVLKSAGKMLSSELIKKFKQTHTLKDKEDQQVFYKFVKEVAKLEEDPPGSKRRYVVLKKQYM